MIIKKWKEMFESMWKKQGSTFIQFLLDAGLDVNALNMIGTTMLSYAAKDGYLEIADCLIQKGGDANVPNIDGTKPLHIAAMHGQKDMVKFFLNKGISVDSLNNAQWTPLHYVSAKKYILLTNRERYQEIVHILLNHDADINAVDINGCTPLLLAAQNSCRDMVELFIKLGANLECCDGDEWTVLHHACARGWSGVVQTLVEGRFEIDLNARNSEGFTPLIIAAHFKYKDIVKRLIEAGVNCKLKTCEGKTVLDYACQLGWLAVVKSFVSEGYDLNTKDSKGNTPLLIAASNSHFRVVKYLIECGADVEVCDKDGQTVLHWACTGKSLYIVKFLLRKGCDLNAKDSKGNTPLIIAAFNSKCRVIEYLIECGADVEGCDEYGWTLLHYACWNRWLDMVKSLTWKGYDVNVRNLDCDTPLLLAVYGFDGSNLEIIKHLFNLGADCNVENIRGETAFVLCIQKTLSLEVITLFLDNGAYFKKNGYAIISSSSLLKERILQNTQFCTWALINKFNKADLHKLKDIPVVSERLPSIEKLKITNQRDEVHNIEQSVKYEIETNGYCNVLKVRPIVLKILCVMTLIKHYN